MTPVLFFKPSGKWYETEEIELKDVQPWEARATIERYLEGRFSGMSALVLEGPWGFPIMFHNIGQQVKP